MIKRALIHVDDTENLIDLANYLNSENWTILSAGRSADLLQKNKIKVTHESAIDENSQFASDIAMLTKQIAETVVEVPDELLRSLDPDYGISLICINTRPVLEFEVSETQYKNFTKPQDFYLASILRVAFQNYENILILTDPADYKEAIIQLRTDNITTEFRTYLAAKALNLVSAYDAGISTSILRSPTFNEPFMNYLMFPYVKESNLKHGSNPQQKASLYRYPKGIGALSGLTKIQTQDLSYNIIYDVSNAWELISTLYSHLKNQYSVKSINRDGYEFTTQFTPLTGTVFTVAIKIGLILGASLSTNVIDSICNTCNYDKDSITNVILGCSAVIDETAAQEIVKGDFAAIVAPGFTPEAREILNQNKKIRTIPTSKVNVTQSTGRLINGGLIIQSSDNVLFNRWHVRTTNRPSQQITDEMAFGTLLSLSAHSYSAILIKNNHIVGISQACASEQKAIREAFAEAKLNETNTDSIADILICSSPVRFTDQLKQLLDTSGIFGIIQSGGHSTDDEFINYCEEKGIVMVFTGMTHYNF